MVILGWFVCLHGDQGQDYFSGKYYLHDGPYDMDMGLGV